MAKRKTYAEPKSATAGESYGRVLNLVFHGLWAYEVQDDSLIVYTPKQPDHAVKAGGWDPEFQLEDGKAYELRGVQGGQNTQFPKDLNAIFRDRQVANQDNLYCTVTLPLPRDIHSLRPISFATTPYMGFDAGLVATKKIATVQVLTYDVVQPSVQLAEIDRQSGKATRHNLNFDLPQPVTNLYFYAQPDGPVHPGHFEEAFGKLAGLFGLDLIPVASMPPGPTNPQLPGLTWVDLVGLNERANHESMLVPAGGFSGSNCDPFVVDNTSPRRQAS